MKYLCDACSRLVELREFSLRDAALTVVCPECRQESRASPIVSAERKPAVGNAAKRPPYGTTTGGRDPTQVPQLARPKPPRAGPLCPKCAAPRAEGRDSCARCGVIFALFRPENLALPVALEALWTELVETSWSAAERHEAFLAACASAQVLTEAARRYRVTAEQAPDDALAAHFRDEAATRLMAIATLPAHPKRAPVTSNRAKAAMAVFLFLASAAFAVLLIQRLLHPPS